jgi:hypothetical protein
LKSDQWFQQTHLFQKHKRNELTQGQKKVCHSAHTTQPELEKKKKKKKKQKIKKKQSK